MNKKRSKKPNNRPKPKAKNKSPWHRFKTIPPKPAPEEIIIPPVADADALADEIEAAEMDVDAEPSEGGDE
jgi:hypothetical protein